MRTRQRRVNPQARNPRTPRTAGAKAQRVSDAPLVQLLRLPDATRESTLALQRTLGNRATARHIGARSTRTPLQRTPHIQRKTEKEKFAGKTYKLSEFIPSTGIGNFDVEFKPKTGVMKVIMKLHFDFTDVDAAYHSTVANKKDIKWTAKQKKEWKREFEQQILATWGSISDIKCVKPGWEDIVAHPEIVIKGVSKSKANFSVKVDKSFVNDTGKMRTAGGSTSVGGLNRDKEAAFQEQDNKDKINDDRVKGHLAQAEKNINIEPAMRRDAERMAKVLAAARSIVFRPNSAALDPGMDGVVAQVAAALLELRKDSALYHLHPIRVNIGLAGSEPPQLAGQRFHAINQALVAAGVKNPTRSVVQQGSRSASFVPGDNAGLVDDYQANWKRLTVAHEFGHMLGLLDEYCQAVSPDLIQMMIDEGRLDAGYTMSNEAQGRVGQDSAKQTAYAKLLEQNDMETPTWARPTSSGQEKSTSIMSGGFEILKQHYVTIWEALGTATQPTIAKDQWKFS